ncbi:MAG: cache domain-containing protein, partial [Leptolyngbyaceae bacterium]|nr:cache domain-containing protein [Leptolyngbyaceae bacterium]
MGLITAGYAGNYFHLPLFFGLDFLFGSIAVLLVLSLYGLTWGIVSACIAGSYTYFLWNHPYAAVILIAEAAFVGLLLRRQSRSLLLLSALYWILIGMPLVAWFYGGILQVSSSQVWLIMLKQAVNGIFNALIAGLLLSYVPIQQWLGRSAQRHTLSLQHTLLNLLVAFIFLPTLLLIVLDGQRVIQEINVTVESNLQSISTDMAMQLGNWHQQHVQGLQELANIAAPILSRPDAGTSSQTEILQTAVKLINTTFLDMESTFVADPAGLTVASDPMTDESGRSRIGQLASDEPFIQDIQRSLKPLITEVHVDEASPYPHVGLSVPVLSNQRLLGFVYSSLKLTKINQLLQSHIRDRGVMILADPQNRIIASTDPNQALMQVLDRKRDGELNSMGNPLIYHWLPAKKANVPAVVRWKQSFYVQETVLQNSLPWTLLVRVPAAPYVNDLQTLYRRNLSIMLLISILALVFADRISRVLISPLSKLAGVTTNLPDKLLEQSSVEWIKSPITEIDALVRNFRLMAIALQEKFREIQRT